MASIYEITDEMLRMQTLLTEEELTDKETDELNFSLALLETDLSAKADGIAKVIKNLTADAEAYKAEADRLTKLRKARENAVNRLKDLMLYAMKATKTAKVGTSIGTWSVQKNPASVHISDTVFIDELPARFTKIKVEADKTALMNAYNAGEELPIGITVEQGESVRFK